MSASSTPLIVNHNNTTYNMNHNSTDNQQQQHQCYNGVASLAGVCNNDNGNILVQQQHDDSMILERNYTNDEVEDTTYNNNNNNTKTITELVNKMHQIDQSSGCNNVDSTSNSNQLFKFLLVHVQILQMLENQTDFSNNNSNSSSCTTARKRTMTSTENEEQQQQKQDLTMNKNNTWVTIAKQFILCRETKLLPIQSEALRWKGIHQSIVQQQEPNKNKNNNPIDEQQQQQQQENDEQHFIPNYVPSITTYDSGNNDVYNHNQGGNTVNNYYKKIGFNLVSNIIQQRKDSIIKKQYYSTVIIPYRSLLQYSQQRLQTLQLYQCTLQSMILQKDSSYYKTIVHQLYIGVSNNMNDYENDVHDTNYYMKTNKKRSNTQQHQQHEEDLITTTMTKRRQKYYPYNMYSTNKKSRVVSTTTCTANSSSSTATTACGVVDYDENINNAESSITNVQSELITVQTKIQLWKNLIHDLQYVLTL